MVQELGPVSTQEEAVNVNLASKPGSSMLLFTVNGGSLVQADLLLRVGFTAPMITAFVLSSRSKRFVGRSWT